MTKLRWLPVSLLAAVLVLSVACGGGDDKDDGGATGASGSPSATVPASSTGSATATVESQSSGSTGSTGSTGASGSTGAITGLKNVKSARFNVTFKMNFDTPQGESEEDAATSAMLAALLGNVQVEGSYVAPDRVQTKSTFFGQTLETIQIGDEQWKNDGSGWVAADSADGTGSSIPFDPSSPDSLFDMVPKDQLDKADKSQESVNGFDTTKYHFDKDALQDVAQSTSGASELGDLSGVDTFDLDVWVTKDGVPVKMAMNLAGESEGSKVSIVMEFNVTDLNDSSITIDKPI
jgi:hypothetical protein